LLYQLIKKGSLFIAPQLVCNVYQTLIMQHQCLPGSLEDDEQGDLCLLLIIKKQKRNQNFVPLIYRGWGLGKAIVLGLTFAG